MRYLITFFLFSFFLYGFNYHLKPYNISDGINCFFGLPSQVSNINGGNMINSCYIETSDGYIVIDSGPTYSYAQEAYAIMKKKKKLPVKYVINTSWDEVHVLGNEFYKELGAELIGPQGYKRHIEEKKVLFLESKLSKDAFLNTRVVPLDKYIAKEEVLVFENIKVKIKTIEDDTNHLYVYIKEKNIVFAGDLVFNNRIVPLNNGRLLTKWLDALDELTSLKWSDIISSHGYMTRRSALKNTKSYLSLLKSEVLSRIKNRESRKDIISNVKLLSFEQDRYYNTWHSKNVSKAYDELKNHLETENFFLEDNIFDSKVIKELGRMEVELVKDFNKSKLEDIITPTLIAKKSKKIIAVDNTKVKYKSFEKALTAARRKDKIVLIKVRSSICKYCDQLDRIMAKNLKVKEILNQYFELVKINIDYETVPLNVMVRSTPTLIFIQPHNKKVLMKLAGIRALGELIEVLNEAVEDGHNANYLKP